MCGEAMWVMPRRTRCHSGSAVGANTRILAGPSESSSSPTCRDSGPAITATLLSASRVGSNDRSPP